MNSPATSERSKDRNAIQIARINARQIILVTIITALSGIAGALIQGMFASGKIESLRNQLAGSTSKVEGLQKDLEGPGASAVEREALYRLTADYIESDLALTDVAIPRLQRSIGEVAERPMAQSVPSALVSLPPEVWILNHAPGDEPTASICPSACSKPPGEGPLAVICFTRSHAASVYLLPILLATWLGCRRSSTIFLTAKRVPENSAEWFGPTGMS